MKKKIKAYVFAVCLCLLFCSDMVLAQAESVTKIHIITPQWKSQTNMDGSGLFFDIIKAVYSPEGITMDFRFAPWKRCQATVNTGSADAMLCVWKSHASAQNQLTPRYPIYVEQTAAVIKKASQITWWGMHAMDYKRAVWLRGYNYHTDPHMEGVQLSLWHEVDSWEDAWRQLNLDRFDVYIDALIDLNNYIREKNIDENLYRIEILWREKAYVAFSNSERSKALIKIFDRQIMKLVESGDLARIYKKWDQPFSKENWQDQSF